MRGSFLLIAVLLPLPSALAVAQDHRELSQPLTAEQRAIVDEAAKDGLRLKESGEPQGSRHGRAQANAKAESAAAKAAYRAAREAGMSHTEAAKVAAAALKRTAQGAQSSATTAPAKTGPEAEKLPEVIGATKSPASKGGEFQDVPP